MDRKDKRYLAFLPVPTLDDLTERKQAEEALRESEERYRSLFNGMTEGFALHEIICDEKGVPCDYRFLEINPAFERLTGLRREDVIGNTIGFDERYVDKIFLPFQRLHGRSSEYEGVGMGLAICKKIVERHGGKITARSSLGKGSTSIVTLPAERKVR